MEADVKVDIQGVSEEGTETILSGRAGNAQPESGHRATVLVVDDEEVGREIVESILASDYQVLTAGSCAEAELVMQASRPDAAILDYELPDGNALDLLPRLRTIDDELPVVVLTAHASIDLAVEAMRQGAEHFFTKPAEMQPLRRVVERCLEHRQHKRRDRARLSTKTPIDPFRGTSKAIRRLAQRAKRVANADPPVLLSGETGCGKGVLARWLHHHGPRHREPFVELNCAGLRPEFLESELFGYCKGAFTGAEDDKLGLLQVADRGTLFLDEIGDMELSIQAKLLKVLEEQSFRRLGGVRDHAVDLRLLAATHHQLAEQVNQGSFRSDLYFRVNTLILEIPPLRQRSEDIQILAEDILRSLGRQIGRPVPVLTASAVRALVGYGWPGNIRELRNVLERAVLLREGETLEASDLHFEGHLQEKSEISDLTLEQVEERHLRQVLKQTDGSATQAIRILDIPRSTFYKKLKKYGIDPRRV